MNLIEKDFQRASILQNLPKLQACTFISRLETGALRFRCQTESEAWDLILISCIHKEEEFVWKSFDEMLKSNLKICAPQILGFYGFQVIAFQLGESVQHFSPAAFQQLILNHARLLKPGEEVLIRFTSLFGILKKRIEESFGKIDYAAAVHLYAKPAAEWDLWIKKILKEAKEVGDSTKILIQDLSSDPIFRFGDEEQTARFHQMFESWTKKNALPEIYLSDQRGFIELGAQFGVRKHV